MIGPLGSLGAAATLGQHCPQMTQRRCTYMFVACDAVRDSYMQVKSTRSALEFGMGFRIENVVLDNSI